MAQFVGVTLRLRSFGLNSRVFLFIRDSLGRETHFTYDDQGRQLSRELPLGQTETFEYDERGRQARHVDFEGRIIDSVFSDDGFLDELLYHDAGSDPDVDTPDEAIAYEWPAVENLIQVL